MRNLVAERDERAARAAAAAISQQLNHLESAFRSLGLRLADGTSPQTVMGQASFLEDDFSSGMAILSADGNIEAASSDHMPWLEFSIIDQANRAADGQTYFIEVNSEGQSGLTAVLIYPIDERTLLGAVSVGELMQSANLTPSLDIGGYQTYIANEHGLILSSMGSTSLRENLSDHPGLVAALRGETGSSFLPSDDGEIVAAYAPIPITRWALVIEEPWEAVTSPVLDFSLAGPLALAPALLLTLLALWFGSRQIIGPLRRLEQQASGMAIGHYADLQKKVGGIAEIINLQETLIEMSKRINQAQEALRGYISAITRAQEDERKRLARELHDETIQDLIALGQKLQMMKMRSHQQEKDRQAAVQDIGDALQETINNIRRISRGLRPIYLEELGLAPALEMLAQDTGLDKNLKVDFHISGEIRRLDPDIEMALYRIVQESLSNISRHSQAQHAHLQVNYTESRVAITIRDDGIGFDPPEETANLARFGHFGLIGMAERADLVGAGLKIESAPAEGTLICLELLFDQEPTDVSLLKSRKVD